MEQSITSRNSKMNYRINKLINSTIKTQNIHNKKCMAIKTKISYNTIIQPEILFGCETMFAVRFLRFCFLNLIQMLNVAKLLYAFVLNDYFMDVFRDYDSSLQKDS